MRRHLVIFARAPRYGTVKRRLARDIGALGALRFHRGTTGRLLREVGRDSRWTTWLAVTPDAALRHPGGLWRARVRLLAQGRGDLGDRMGRVFTRLGPGPVVIVGSDVPGIRAGRIAAAFDRLGSADWVLGPAHDGGYWLIGARRRPALRIPFANVVWGGPTALADTLANLQGHGVEMIETMVDVDTGADLALLKKNRP